MKRSHKPPPGTSVSALEYCVNEYVIKKKHREILMDHFFWDFTLEELAAKYNTSVTTIKRIVYTTGDFVIDKAAKLNKD